MLILVIKLLCSRLLAFSSHHFGERFSIDIFVTEAKIKAIAGGIRGIQPALTNVSQQILKRSNREQAIALANHSGRRT